MKTNLVALVLVVCGLVVACGKEGVSDFVRPQKVEKVVVTDSKSVVVADDVKTQPAVPVSVQASLQTEPMQEHEVQKGEWLILIADHYGVGWEAILLANEEFLKAKYDEICPKFPDKIKNKPGRKGLFCNNKYKRPYSNTLMPGWKLKIPPTKAPANISTAVANISGLRVALVIDDTGSMIADRRAVGEFYLAAIKAQGKKVVGVWLYADGHIRRYEGGGVLEMNTSGRVENTHSALQEAAEERPDAIVLITDEPGDDWNWVIAGELPPVVAHCLEERQNDGHGNGFTCEANLLRLVGLTKGQYMSGL